MAKRTVIHVNQHNIKSNSRNGTALPVLTVKDYKANRKGNTATILDESGNVIAEVVYRPSNPLPCGARCWIQTEKEVYVD